MVQFFKGRAIALAVVLELLFFAIAVWDPVPFGNRGCLRFGGHGTSVDYPGGSAWEM